MIFGLICLLVVLLPLNLGYHFVLPTSYINGLLVDYLIPTIFLQDLVVLLIFVVWLVKGGKFRPDFYRSWFPRLLLFFIFSLFLSTLVSINYPISVVTLLRFSLYILFSLIIGFSLRLRYMWPTILKVLLFGTLFLSLLALLQFIKQGAVFNNYLFFGEQPYTFSTYGISRESFFGKTIIPPYGTFRHPNVLGGFLSVVILWLLANHHMFSKRVAKLNVFVVLLSSIVVFLTTSLIAILALCVGIFLNYLLPKLQQNTHAKVFAVTIVVSIIFANALPYLNKLIPDNPSIYRRIGLYQVVNDNLDDYFWYGTGLASSTEISADHFKYFDAIKYPQPVHNIFVLIFIEAGFFVFIFYLGIFVLVITSTKPQVYVFRISFVQFIILGLFDHYLLTMHQTLLLFWLTLGFYFAYNYNS